MNRWSRKPGTPPWFARCSPERDCSRGQVNRLQTLTVLPSWRNLLGMLLGEFSWIVCDALVPEAHAISPVVRSGHPALRSLDGNLAPASWLRSVSNAARLAWASGASPQKFRKALSGNGRHSPGQQQFSPGGRVALPGKLRRRKAGQLAQSAVNCGGEEAQPGAFVGVPAR